MIIGVYILVRLIVLLAIYGLGAVVCYLLLTTPWRRRERSRIVLDLIELGLQAGSTPEQTIVAAAASQDWRLPRKLRWLAAHLEQGLSLGEALERTPRLLPPELTAILRLGGRLGDYSKVIPVCRAALNDGPNAAKAGLAYVIILLLAPPISVGGILLLLRTIVFPKFQQIFDDLVGSARLPALSQWVFNYLPWVVASLLVVQGGLYLWAFARTGGPWFERFTRLGWLDRLQLLVPWKRRRMQRNFGAMFALLLDAGATEESALRDAAACAANRVFSRRAERAVAQLRQGVPLTDCVRQLDPAGEFRWRLANAAHGGRGFVAALRGWLRALDASAARQEMSAAQAFVSGVILANGAAVAAVSLAVFLVFIHLLNEIGP